MNICTLAKSTTERATQVFESAEKLFEGETQNLPPNNLTANPSPFVGREKNLKPKKQSFFNLANQRSAQLNAKHGHVMKRRKGGENRCLHFTPSVFYFAFVLIA
jgi:hypothetical protein